MKTPTLNFSGLQAQTYTLSGHITDAATGETLIGATLYEALSQTGTSANGYGFYSLRLPAGKHKLQCAYLGYNTKEIEVQLDGDKTLEIKLEENSVGLGEVTVEAAAVERPQKQNEFHAEMLTIQSIRKPKRATQGMCNISKCFKTPSWTINRWRSGSQPSTD